MSAPRTPKEALERLRDEDTRLRAVGDTLIADQVKLFNRMTFEDRLEFLFRTQVTTMTQMHILLNQITGSAGAPREAAPPTDAA